MLLSVKAISDDVNKKLSYCWQTARRV